MTQSSATIPTASPATSPTYSSLANEIEAAGARLEFITQEMDSSPEGKMFFAIRGAVAEYEKAKIRERTARGRKEKARQGKLINPHNLPIWLRWNPEMHLVEIDEEWAQVVRLAFRLIDDEGCGPSAIARRFMALGIRTPLGATYWQESTIRGWLKDTTAKGEFVQFHYEAVEPLRLRAQGNRRRKSSYRLRPQQEHVVLPVPPIVSPDVWDRAQRRLDFNREMATRNARHEYLLRGFVRCGSCGLRMTGRYRNQVNRRYYRCPHGRDMRGDIPGEVCVQPVVLADDLEQAVWDALARLLRDPQLLLGELRRRHEEGSFTKTSIERDLGIARKRLGDIPAEMDRLIEGYGKGLIPDDRMRLRMGALTDERDELTKKAGELEQRLRRLQAVENIEDQVLAFVEKVRDKVDVLDAAGRRRLLELVLEDVTCHSDHAIVRTVIPPSDTSPPGQLCAPPREGGQGDEVSAIGTDMDSE